MQACVAPATPSPWKNSYHGTIRCGLLKALLYVCLCFMGFVTSIKSLMGACRFRSGEQIPCAAMAFEASRMRKQEYVAPLPVHVRYRIVFLPDSLFSCTRKYTIARKRNIPWLFSAELITTKLHQLTPNDKYSCIWYLSP